METMLDHVELTDEQHAEYRAIMLAGNPVIRKWADLLGMRLEGFTRALFGGAIHPMILGYIPGDELEAMWAVRRIESPMIFGWVKLLEKVGRKCMAKYGRHYCGDLEDVILEGVIGLRRAVYGYAREDVAFKTYAHRVVENVMRDEIAGNYDLSGLNGDDYILMAKYQEAKSLLPRNASPAEIASQANLSDLELRRVQAMTSRFGRPDESEETYYGMGSLPDRADDLAEEREVLAEAIETAGLTPQERTLFTGWMVNGHGYISDVERAGTFPNRKGEPMTRAGLWKILNSARAKVEAKVGVALREVA